MFTAVCIKFCQKCLKPIRDSFIEKILKGYASLEILSITALPRKNHEFQKISVFRSGKKFKKLTRKNYQMTELGMETHN